MSKTATIGAAIFRYRVGDSRRYAFKGQTVELSDEDYARAEANELLVEQRPKPETSTLMAENEYDQTKVDEAIAYLEGLPEDARAPYFELEKERERQGVLKHFDQLDE